MKNRFYLVDVCIAFSSISVILLILYIPKIYEPYPLYTERGGYKYTEKEGDFEEFSSEDMELLGQNLKCFRSDKKKSPVKPVSSSKQSAMSSPAELAARRSEKDRNNIELFNSLPGVNRINRGKSAKRPIVIGKPVIKFDSKVPSPSPSTLESATEKLRLARATECQKQLDACHNAVVKDESNVANSEHWSNDMECAESLSASADGEAKKDSRDYDSHIEINTDSPCKSAPKSPPLKQSYLAGDDSVDDCSSVGVSPMEVIDHLNRVEKLKIPSVGKYRDENAMDVQVIGDVEPMYIDDHDDYRAGEKIKDIRETAAVSDTPSSSQQQDPGPVQQFRPLPVLSQRYYDPNNDSESPASTHKPTQRPVHMPANRRSPAETKKYFPVITIGGDGRVINTSTAVTMAPTTGGRDGGGRGADKTLHGYNNNKILQTFPAGSCQVISSESALIRRSAGTVTAADSVRLHPRVPATTTSSSSSATAATTAAYLTKMQATDDTSFAINSQLYRHLSTTFSAASSSTTPTTSPAAPTRTSCEEPRRLFNTYRQMNAIKERKRAQLSETYLRESKERMKKRKLEAMGVSGGRDF